MDRLRYVRLLLLPSVGSFVAIFVTSLTVIGVASWSFGAQNGRLYDYLLGPNSGSALIADSKSTLQSAGELVFGNQLLSRLLFVAFWLAIGLMVYAIVAGMGRSVHSVLEYRSSLHYVNAHRDDAKKQFGIRVLVRTIAALILFIYMVFFLQIFLPFSTLAARIGFSNLTQPGGWAYSLIAVLELMFCLHILIVLFRFFALRPRLFSTYVA